MDMSSGQKKKLFAVALVALLVLGAILVILLGGKEEGSKEMAATIDDLLASTSQRTTVRPGIVVASYSDRAYPMIATPVAAYYLNNDLVSAPFLVAGYNEGTQDDSVSTSVTRFLDAYPEKEAVVIGPLEGDVKARLSYSGMQASRELSGDPTTVSISAARMFWTSSDGAVLMTPCYEGYRTGLTAATLASYLNIPIIVCHGIDDDVLSLLAFLEVKYTVICGPAEGYGKVLRVQDPDDILDALVLGMPSADGSMRSVMTDKLGIDPRYITLADPYDANLPKVVDSFTEHFSGTVTGSDTGSTSDPSLSDTAEIHHIEIPEDYQYARVKISLVVDFVDSPVPLRTPEDDGQRGYLYFGVDSDEDGKIIRDEDSADDHLEFMLPTLAYAYVREGTDAVSGLAYTEEPLFNAQGKHAVELLATLAYDPLGREQSTTYSIDLTVEKLDIPNHPLMPLSSVCAPYLTVNRQGVLLARDEFSIYNDPDILSSKHFGDPSVDHTAYENGSMQLGGLPAISNKVAVGVKEKLNWLLSCLSGQEGADGAALASYFGPLLETDPYYVGIVGDTNNIPMFYYPNSGQGDLPQEGYYIAGDVFYSSLDVDTETPPNDIGGRLSSELAVGRIDGWDAQDISALICRTLFYDSITGSFEGLREGTWEDSAINNFGSQVPVGTSITVSQKISEAEQRSGFTVDNKHYSPLSDSRLTRELYEKSNFIYFCAHGFYYWFVPPGYKPTSVGGSYNVANVVEMNFGPSVLFGSSCVTGKVDGIMAYNALSQAFLHSGMNAYIGASRLSWGSVAIIPDMQSGEAFGSYLGLLFFGYLTGYLYDKQGHLISENLGDLTTGQSLALAKNIYAINEGYDPGDANSDTLCEFNLHGDPAFNPFEPNHEG